LIDANDYKSSILNWFTSQNLIEIFG